MVEVGGVRVTAHDGKVAALTYYFKEVLGTPGESRFTFNLAGLYEGRPTASNKLT